MKRFKRLYVKAKPKLLIGISLILILIAIMNIYYSVEVNVTSNDECLWVPENPAADSTAIYFNIVKVGGVTWNAGIRDGDQLLKINGKSIKTTPQAQLILNTVNSGEYANYVVRKKGGSSILETKVFVKKLIQLPLFAFSILGLIWMTIGFIVLTAKQGSIQKIFYLTGASSVLVMVFLFFPQPGTKGNILTLVMVLGWCFGISFISFFVAYFFWIFPKQFKFDYIFCFSSTICVKQN